MLDNYYALIMAGGGGTRLWPMSRRGTPKQLLSLIDQRSMFRTSVDRLFPLFYPERVYVVTGPEYVTAMRNDSPAIPDENFLVEPYGKNTGPAAALGVSIIHHRDPEATIALLTADHHVAQEQDFRDILRVAYEVSQDDYVVTLGVSPTFPSTGFGYIRQGEELCQINGRRCYESLGFTEKPDLITATEFLTSGQYSWNSGMFIWTAKNAMAEFERQQPEITAALNELAPYMNTADHRNILESVWAQMPSISIDLAVMENAAKMAVIPADIGWSDIGSWGALFDLHQLDDHGNLLKSNGPESVIVDTQNTMVISDRLIAMIGVENVIVIDTEDALLICHKDRSQDVKDVVSQLRSTGNHAYL